MQEMKSNLPVWSNTAHKGEQNSLSNYADCQYGKHSLHAYLNNTCNV